MNEVTNLENSKKLHAICKENGIEKTDYVWVETPQDALCLLLIELISKELIE